MPIQLVTGDFTYVTQVTAQAGGGETGIVAKDGLDASSSFVAVVLQSGGTIVRDGLGSAPATILSQDNTMAMLRRPGFGS